MTEVIAQQNLGTSKTLTELLDLSLRTPEIGAVNFNILHKLLAHILEHIGLSDTVTTLSKDIPQLKIGPSVTDLEKKVLTLENQLGILNQLPTAQDVLSQSRGGAQSNPAAAAWQSIQIRNKVTTNEAGVSKSLGLIDEILSELKMVRDFESKMEKRMNEQLGEMKKRMSMVEKGNEEIGQKVEEFDEQLKKLNNYMDQMPSLDQFAQFVTFPVISQALISKNDSCHGSTDREKGTYALEKVGQLFDRLDELEVRLKNTEVNLPEKADLSDLKEMKKLVKEVTKFGGGRGGVSLQDQIDQINEQMTQLSGEQAGFVTGCPGGAFGYSGRNHRVGEGGGISNIEFTKMSADVVRLDQMCKDLGKKLSIYYNETRESDLEFEDKTSTLRTAIKQIRTDIMQMKKVTDSFENGELTQLLNLFGLTEDAKKERDEVNEQMFEALGLGGYFNLNHASILASPHIPVTTKLALHRKIMESNALKSLQNGLLGLQAEVQKLAGNIGSALDENQNNQEQMKKLFTYFETLDEEKANKKSLMKDIEVKADKRQLISKVDRQEFEAMNQQLTEKFECMFDETHSKDSEWKTMMEKLASEIESKLDRVELDSIKQQLEKRLNLLRKLMDERVSGPMREADGDDAAGFRKGYNYNCISCNRPLEMTPTGPYPAIPANANFPYTKTVRPYTTYELDQIRQQARGLMMKSNYTNYKMAVQQRELARMKEIENIAYQIDLTMQTYITGINPAGYDMKDPGRACGGNYTMTYPQRRYTRLTHVSELWQEEEAVQQTVNANEVQIQGHDGQIYRGRLPALSATHPPPPQTAPSLQQAASAFADRPPSSARSRSSSARRANRLHPPGLAERLAATTPSPPPPPLNIAVENLQQETQKAQ